jgi:hypothetical protein
MGRSPTLNRPASSLATTSRQPTTAVAAAAAAVVEVLCRQQSLTDSHSARHSQIKPYPNKNWPQKIF